MNQSEGFSWPFCFAGQGNAKPHAFRVLSRTGHKFFCIPDNRHEGTAILDAYQPQRSIPKLFMRLLRRTTRWGGLLLLQKTAVSLDESSPFAEFLREASGMDVLPRFAVLQGNPHAKGSRVVFFVMGHKTLPVCAVKAGWTDEARFLVKREASLLSQIGGRNDSIPRCTATFEHGRLSAFSMSYANGSSPKDHDMRGVAATLGSWIQDGKSISLENIPTWERCLEGLDATILYQLLSLSSHKVTPVIFHGDFAPWNIRSSEDSKWCVIDWERGEHVGVPGWDWFHYVIQSSTLIRRDNPSKVIRRVNEVIASSEFEGYAIRTNIRGHEYAILCSYLAYALNLRQTEGFETLDALARHFFNP